MRRSGLPRPSAPRASRRFSWVAFLGFAFSMIAGPVPVLARARPGLAEHCLSNVSNAAGMIMYASDHKDHCLAATWVQDTFRSQNVQIYMCR